MESNISESPKHAVRLEYTSDGSQRIKTWESVKDGDVLETVFSEGGTILDRHLLKAGKTPKEHAEEFVEVAGLEPRENVYEAVSLQKGCPKCGSSVSCIIEGEQGDIPVMPVYMCDSCKSKSYCLTDQYLILLISRNIKMFSEAELEAYTKNPEEFIKDVKANINRMFAAKHIYEIK
jgi:hypothetical protein